MRRLRKYRACNLCLAGLLLCGSACTKEETAKGFPKGDLLQVGVHTRANGKNAPATLMFWNDVHFHDYLMKESFEAVPYGSVDMKMSIDSYRYGSGETFSTGLTYPEGNDYLHATGYAPAKALRPENGNNYLKLQVAPEYRNGKTDFLCCDGNWKHRGAFADPFTEEEHELNFRHLTSRIRFVGKRDPVMYGVISVNNVTVTLRNANAEEKKWSVPTEFSLHTSDSESPRDDKCTYVVSGSMVPEFIELPQENQNYIPADEKGLDLSACYVHQTYPTGYDPFVELEKKDTETIPLTLDITADFSWYNNGNPVKYGTYTWENHTVEVKSDYGDVMLPGCEYMVYITFKREGVTLQGVQQAWEDGGIHYLPVVPDNSKE